MRLAARALGRLEDSTNARALLPLLRHRDATVRAEAITALGQMRAAYPYPTLLIGERDPVTRGVIHETIGRIRPALPYADSILARGVADGVGPALRGAMRGAESYARLNARTSPPSAALTSVIRAAFARSTDSQVRQLALLALSAAGDRDSATFASGLRDRDPQVRRLAVAGARRWIDDPSPMVRYQALRAAGTCERAAAHVRDTSEHVSLAAIDLLGTLKCSPTLLEPLLQSGRTWRERAHALVSLAAVSPTAARSALPTFAADPVWQVRTYAAAAARALGESETLARLARDREPNVAIAALTTTDDALRALGSEHAGLALAGAEHLKGAPGLAGHLPQLVTHFERFTRTGPITTRDQRAAMLARIGEISDTGTNALLRSALRDQDPAIAAQAAAILTRRTGAPVMAETRQLPVPPLATAKELAALAGAQARITMRGGSTMLVDLTPDVAPATVATFAALADSGRYNGLTFHRIVPNFVVQGGSPGADEYDARTTYFMRDEVGRLSNARGTLGISTRGRDTGDGQIYLNLIDNFRLDHDYTVFGTIRGDLSVMDRIQEGDVIERIEIIRRPR